MAKFTVVPLLALPRLTTCAVIGKLTDAPWNTQNSCGLTAISEVEDVAVTDATTDFAGIYTPGASVAVMSEFPVVAGVTPVDAIPFSSLMAVHVEAPAHAESVAPL